MAIDDNTSYELTGAQVKDLANKIKGKAADNTFVGATPAAPGSKGLVPVPQAGDNAKFLSGDGTWKDVPAGSSYTAGNGIDITNNVISADTNVLATNKLVKNLAGGAPRVANRINVSKLSDYEEATEISNQINNPDVYPALLQSTLIYAFYDLDWGKYLNRDEIGQAIDENCNFVYFGTTSDDGYGQKIIVNAKSNYNSEANTYSPSFLIYEINSKTPYGGGKMYTLSLNASTQTGLEDWYETSSSTWAYEPSFVIQRMTAIEAQEIANEINANNPGIEVTSFQVQAHMKFVCRNASTGKLIKTASGFRSALYRATAGYVLFLPTIASGSYATLEVMVYRGGNTKNAGFNLMNMETSVVTPYNIVNPSSSYGTNAEYMWYIAEANSESAYQLSYGYTNAITSSTPTDAPETTFQTAVDASGNLYMASGSSNASDWKQINNTATVNNGALTIQQNGTTLGTFTANSSDDKTVNIQTITAATVAPAEEVGAITTNMIADGAVTAKKINPTSFAMLVYVGDIAYVKGTYNNSSIPLTNKIDYYAASDVGAAIESSTNLVITVPTDGTYIARAKASLWTNSNSWDYMTLSIRKNGNIFTRTMAPKINGSWGFVDTEGYTTVANGDALTVYLNTNGNNFTDENMSRRDSKLMVEIYKVG